MITALNNRMKKCILVYDDDIEILEVTRLILEEKQYHVESRTRCDDIIKDIEDVKPDVILMDIWIPEIGGETAICLIKHDEVINTIPVIIFSAITQIETLSKRVNADAYLKKPFDIAQLISVVEQNTHFLA
jgi:DNA-binding NtrC family response regulator